MVVFSIFRLCSPHSRLAAFLTHAIHTYVIDTGLGGRGGMDGILKILGAIKCFSALFQEQTSGLIESEHGNWLNER